MLTLNRPRRQGLATVALVILTVLPTLCVASLAWQVHRPGHVRDVEVRLGRELGLQVSLRSVRHPSPGVDVLQGIVLRHEEPRGKTFHEVARAERVTIHRSGGEFLVEASNLLLRGENGKQAVEVALGQLGRVAEGSWSRMSLTAPTCEIELGTDGPSVVGFTVREVVATCRVEGGTPVLSASYRMLGQGPTTRCEVTLRRDRSTRPYRSTVAFESKEGLPLPARVLDPYFASAEWFGAEARVWGALTLSRVGEGDWQAEFRGDLLGVDLATLVARRFPDHRLSGEAKLQVRSARWGSRGPGLGPGWIGADGTLSAGPGVIGGSLLEALGRELHFRIAPRPARDADEDVAFQGLGLDFAMQGDGKLRCSGNLGTEFPAGAVIVDGERGVPMASAPVEVGSVRGLWNVLVPQREGRALIVDDAEALRLRNYLPASPALGSQKAN